jgi:enterobacterial common antigen flippase
MKPAASYGQILRSSSILGGSQVLIYLISIGRTKAAALLLGPAGVGTLGLFQSIVTMIGTVSSLGIGHSGVREIAEASGSGNEGRVRTISSVLQRFALITGILGWLFAAVLAYPISQLAFGNSHQTGSIALLGACLLLGAVGTSYAAILQGTRRIGNLAKFQVASNAIAAVIAVVLFSVFGLHGIVPAIIAGAAGNCGMALWMRKSTLQQCDQVSWRETIEGSRSLIAMGLAFMWNAVSTGLVAFGVRAMVVRHEGLDSAGIYQAAWAISGMFAGFILQAMGTDFYPRLTAASGDKSEMTRLINEQTEIGVLLAGPGVLFTLSLAPYLMEWLYSAKFVSGTPLVCWFALGVFGQVVSWPLGFIQIAKGASRSFIVTQTLFNGFHFGLLAFFFHRFGMLGTGMAYVALYLIYTASMLCYAKQVIDFRWSASVIRLVLVIGIMVALGFILAVLCSGPVPTATGLILAIVGGFVCARELIHRLPENHRLVNLLLKIPGIARFQTKH